MRRAFVSALLVTALLGADLGAAGVARADSGTDLYVDNRHVNASSVCSDSGPGSLADPFCTIQAAAAVALPGQTVHVEGTAAMMAVYSDPVAITRSGTPGAPITFEADGFEQPSGVVLGGTHAFVVTNAHDIVLKGFQMSTTQSAVVLTGSSDISVVGNTIGNLPADGNGITVTGPGSGVTISDNKVWTFRGAGISVQGVSGSVLSTNFVSQNEGAGIAVGNAPDTTIVSNTITTNCAGGLRVDSGSGDTGIENNIVSGDSAADWANGVACPGPAVPEISMDSAPVSLDYNLVHPITSQPPYLWAGTGYAGPAALTAATGQGAHDLDADPKLNAGGMALTEGSPAIDSADAGAPGEQVTDLLGKARVNDPTVADTGTGAGYYDRGAVEFQDPYSASGLTSSITQGPYPLTVTLTVQVSNLWSDPIGYTYDFGDGTATVTTTATSVSHTYTGPVSKDTSYAPRVSATKPDGTKFSESGRVELSPPGPLVATLSVSVDMWTSANAVFADSSASTGPWAITTRMLDFGDGSAPVDVSKGGWGEYRYQKPGTYTVTLTITDTNGDTATTSQPITVGGTFVPTSPTRILDTRIGTGAEKAPLGPNSSLSLQVTGLAGVPADATSVILNVTVTNPTTGGYLTVYPGSDAGSDKPTASNVNFAAGQTIPNLVTVPFDLSTQSVLIYNHTGSVDVIADVEGYFVPTGGSTYTSSGPARLLDTRNGTGAPRAKVGPGGILSVPVAGAQGLPATGITAVVMNVTVTNPTAGGYLTVYPGGSTPPLASNLNFTAGETISNLVTVPVGPDGTVRFYNRFGSVDLVADIEGYYGSGGMDFMPTHPQRLADTRNNEGFYTFGPDSSQFIYSGLPSGAAAVVLNVTVTNPTAGSYLTVYDADAGGVPLASNLNFGAGETISNLVVVPVNPINPTVSFYNRNGNVDVVVDLEGYYQHPRT